MLISYILSGSITVLSQRSTAASRDARSGRPGLAARPADPAVNVPGFPRFAVGALQADPAGQEIAAAWIGKEKLRHVLNLRARVTGSVPCQRDVRGRLFAFYDWCAQNDDIPELISLARTVSRWEDEIICAVLTGVTNAASESLNRLAPITQRNGQAEWHFHANCHCGMADYCV